MRRWRRDALGRQVVGALRSMRRSDGAPTRGVASVLAFCTAHAASVLASCTAHAPHAPHAAHAPHAPLAPLAPSMLASCTAHAGREAAPGPARAWAGPRGL